MAGYPWDLWRGRRVIVMTRRSAQFRSMRYAPAERLLRLARHLAATRTGLTLDEMATELEVRAEAVAAIETSARECEVRGETDRAALLREASTALRATSLSGRCQRTHENAACRSTGYKALAGSHGQSATHQREVRRRQRGDRQGGA